MQTPIYFDRYPNFIITFHLFCRRGHSVFNDVIHLRMLATNVICLGMKYPVSQSLGIRIYRITTNLFGFA